MQNKNNKHNALGSLRIIAGRWRGRKLTVLDSDGLRPTADRIRETLFNWLQADVGFSHCLDLYAGTGALGLEAASRGAKNVTLVEADPKVAQQLTQHCQTLQADNCQVLNQSAMTFLTQNQQQYDIVFIDPPYQDLAWDSITKQLIDTNALAENALIYVEYPRTVTSLALPSEWQLLKEKTAGEVNYALYQHH